MTRYIDADALKEWFPDNGEGSWTYNVTVKSCIDAQPTIDAEPVRHGKNIGTDYDEVDQFVCSECGIELQDWRRVERDDYDGEETFHEYRLRYCPNCGARMDGND